MAESINKFESKRGRPPKHPWDSWADKKARKLYKGSAEEVSSGQKDFQADLISFRTMVHREARLRGLRAFTHINKADQSIRIQFYARDPS